VNTASGPHTGHRHGRGRGALVIALIGVLAVLVGCGPFVDPSTLQDQAEVPSGVLGGDATVAQEFTIDCNGFTGLEVQVARFPTVASTDGTLVLTLVPAPLSGERSAMPRSPVLARADRAVAELVANQWIHLSFEPLARSRGQRFLLIGQVEGTAPSAVTLWATGRDTGIAGTRYVNGHPVPGALVLRAYCDEPWPDVIGETARMIGRSGWLWPVAAALCIVPGVGLAFLLEPDDDPAALLGLGVGWSVLLAPLAFALTTPFRIGGPLGPVLLLGGAVAGIIGIRRRRSPLALGPASAVTIAATSIALILRAITAKDLIAPMWGDPVQHSYVADLLLTSRGVPATYGALVPSQVFDYHFGFQALSALAAWLAGSTTADAVLATGQILDALICLAVYRLGRDLTDSPGAAAVAALLVGLIMTQPAYYISWGRYPELAGLVALPAAASALRSAVSRPPPISASALPAVVGATAMVLVHPRVAVFLASLGLALVIVPPSPDASTIVQRGGRLLLVGTASLVLLTPWALRLWNVHHAAVVGPFRWMPINFPLGLATAGNDRWVMGAAIVSLVIGTRGRPRLSLVMLLWGIIVFVVGNPATFHLPLNLFVDNGSIAIALFLPAAILTGSLADLTVRAVIPRGRRSGTGWVIAGLGLAAAAAAAPGQLSLINPTCLIIRPADRAALDWVRTHTPADARFLINGFRWTDSIWMGSDAGYWLPVLAGRRTTLPPLFYAGGPPDLVRSVNATAAAVDRHGSDPAALASIARQSGAQYIFVGTRGGPINPEVLAHSPLFRTVYRAGGDWVFELTSGASGTTSSTVTGRTPHSSGPPSV
jgi:hypothetical protein